jgi:hypothetical protein
METISPGLDGIFGAIERNHATGARSLPSSVHAHVNVSVLPNNSVGTSADTASKAECVRHNLERVR